MELEDDTEDANDTDTGESRGVTSSGSGSAEGDLESCMPISVCSSRSSSPSGSGRCSATNVSCPTDDVLRCFQAANTSVRPLVNSHWSTYSHIRFLGVLPVGKSSLAPCSASACVACCTEARWLDDAALYPSVAAERALIC